MRNANVISQSRWKGAATEAAPAPGEGLDFSGVTTIRVFGDSFTNPGDAATAGNSWIELFEAETGKTIDNQASTGRGVGYMIQRMFAVGDVAGGDEGIIAFSGFNDIRYVNSAKKILQIKHAYRSLIASQFADPLTAIPGGDDSVTNNFEGFWNRNLSSAGFNGKGNSFPSTTRASASTGQGNPTNTINCSWAFSGTTLVIGYTGYDDEDVAFRRGRLEVLIDSVVIETLDPAGQTDGIPNPPFEMEQRAQPACKVYTNLSSGNHTLMIRPLDPGVSKVIDWLGTLKAPGDCKPVLIIAPTYQPDYNNPDGFDKANDAAMDAVRTALEEVAAEFPGYPVAVVNPNVGLNVNTMFDADDIHPNDLGHNHIFEKVMEVVTV